MLIEVIKQPEIHSADFTKYKYYLAHFDNFTMREGKAEYLKTWVKNSDADVIENLKKSCSIPNLSGNKRLILLTKIELVNGIYEQPVIYKDLPERIQK